MGLGKTPITLTTIVDRMRAGQVNKVLIFGSVRIIQSVWAREARKWSHTKHLRFSVVYGNKDTRQRRLFKDADIYLINYENTNWLAEVLMKYYLSQGKPLPFQMVVYDEISKFKNPTSLRMAGGNRDRKVRGSKKRVKVNYTGWVDIVDYFKYATGLTGTPASNGYIDLHGQYLAIDGGKRLGRYVTHFREKYFQSDYNGWNYTPTPYGVDQIQAAISDITKKMDSKDYLDLPPVKITNMMVDLPPGVRKKYDELEENLFTVLDTGKELEVFNKASLSNKVLQMANGAPYVSIIDEETGQNRVTNEFEELHDAKLNALDDVLEEAAGSPVLCSYTFKSDAARIMKKFKHYRPVNLTASRSADTEKIINRWNNGDIKLMIGHPASMGHGIDGLQQSGHIIVWFGLNWSLELYYQMNARIDRNGQTQPVSLIRILANDTLDLAVADALQRKSDDEQSLKDAIGRYREGITTNELKLSFL